MRYYAYFQDGLFFGAARDGNLDPNDYTERVRLRRGVTDTEVRSANHALRGMHIQDSVAWLDEFGMLAWEEVLAERVGLLGAIARLVVRMNRDERFAMILAVLITVFAGVFTVILL